MFGHDSKKIEAQITNLDAEQGEHWHHLFHTLAAMEETIMAVSAQVQANLDAVRQTQNLVKSVEAGLAVQKQMIIDQGTQIAALQAQIAAGATLGADDIAALAETNTDLASVNASLTNDIPANTGTSASSAAPADGSKPQPLPGTGT